MTNNNRKKPRFTIQNGVLKKCDLNGNTHIVLPDTVQKIGEYAFHCCENLSCIELPNVKVIGTSAFGGCKKLSSIECPNVQEIGQGVFCGCKNLSCIKLPNVKVIGTSAFSGCTNLSCIELLNVKVIGMRAFFGCTSLEEIILSENNTKYHFEDRVLYNKDQTEIIWGNVQNYTAPLSVVKIGYHAFSKCKNLSSISCPNVQTINSEVFNGCTNLSCIEFPNVKVIGMRAFSMCTNLSCIELPNVKMIGEFAFSICTNLSCIELPNVKVIGMRAFFGCKNLSCIECPNVQTIGKEAFFLCKKLTTIIIPHNKIFKSYECFLKSDLFDPDQKVILSMNLLVTKNDLFEREKKKYQIYLSRGAKKLVCKIIDQENMEALILCEQAGLLTKRRIDSFVEYASEQGKVAFTAYLMNYKHEHFPVK